MNQGINTNLLIGLAVLVALIFLNRATRKELKPDAAGRYHLRMNNLYSLGGVLGLLLGLGLIIVAALRNEHFNFDVVAMMAVILCFCWGPAIPSLLYFKNHRVVLDDTTITVVDVFGKSKTIAWEDITVARVKPLTGMIQIYTPQNTVKVHQHLIGLAHLINKFTEKKGWTAYDIGIR
jgi:hypothetical protein